LTSDIELAIINRNGDSIFGTNFPYRGEYLRDNPTT
jgi:hypothetical protein